jgi:hypothetical protein
VQHVASVRGAERAVAERQAGRVRSEHRWRGAALGEELREHGRRQIDADDVEASRGEWTRQDPRPDADLQHASPTGELAGEQIEGLIRRVLADVARLVVELRGPIEVHRRRDLVHPVRVALRDVDLGLR